MTNIFIILQITTAILLIVLIIMQPRGKGFSRSFGSPGTSFTRRGLEKVIFRTTFVVSGIFILASILQLAL